MKLAEGEASKLRSKMDNFLYGSAKSNQTLQTIQQKQSLAQVLVFRFHIHTSYKHTNTLPCLFSKSATIEKFNNANGMVSRAVIAKKNLDRRGGGSVV